MRRSAGNARGPASRRGARASKHGNGLPATASTLAHDERLTLIAEREREDHAAEARRLALEINDSIVQGLVLVRTTLALGCGREQGLEIVSRTLATARRMTSDLLGERTVEPGDLVRSRAAGAVSLDGVPLDGPPR